VKKPFAEAHRVIALFKQIHAGTDAERDARTEFQLADGEYDQIESTLQQDDVLSGYVDEKIRYDYDEDKRKLVVRMRKKCILPDRPIYVSALAFRLNRSTSQTRRSGINTHNTQVP
jgi:hypothetical protein